MAGNEIKQSHNEISRIVKKPVENIYGLASLVRVFFARCIDLILVAIPVIIVASAWRLPELITHWDNGKRVIDNFTPWSHAVVLHTVIQLVVWLVSVLVFLVIIPSFAKGTTIGKGICGIRLKRSTGDKKVKWWMLLAREAYFVLIPWIIAVVIQCITLGVLLTGNHDQSNGAIRYIQNLPMLFCFLWYLFLLITIKAQSEHQSGIDMHFGLFVVYKEPIKQITKEVEIKERSLILTDEPGNLSKESINNLDNSEKKKFDKSISLEDLDLEVVKEDKKKNKKDDDEPKKIEGDK